jgi:adenine-specific DNA-methyltransferase
MPEIEKLTLNHPDTQSADIVAGNLAALQALFPEAFSEGRIDFEVLKQVLGGAVDERDEKYGLNWHGKRRARQIALTPSTGTLLPCPQDSVDWDTTQNLMIEGDNLEVLKLLQKSYAGKVKMVYIDPPYNTGKDFVYPDDFRDGIRNYLELTGQIEGGKRINSNTDSSGRFHTDWLNMIYPRIKVARNLLSEDGVIFISIDDNEVDRLRFVCDEIFGEENFVAQFVWNTEGHTDNQFDAKIVHEYVVVYAKNADIASLGHVVDPNTRAESNLWKGFAENSITKNGPANPPSVVLLPHGFPCVAKNLDIPKSNVTEAYFEAVKVQGFISRDVTDKFDVSYPVRLGAMHVEDGKLVAPCKVFSGWANAKKLKAFIENDCQPILDGGDKVSFYISPNGVIYYRRDREKARNILSVLRNFGTTEKMRAELERDGIIFQYPKPKEFVNYLVQIGCPENGIVLDFFAGSGTISQSCFERNAADSFSRRLIVVQLPEPTRFLKENGKWEESLSWKAGFKTIFDITRKRLLRAGENIKSAMPMFKGDLGFRVYKLASSNIRAWEPVAADLENTLLAHAEHLVQGRTEADVLTELLLKLGLDLCVPIETKQIAGKAVHSIGAGALIACLSDGITRDVAEALGTGIVAWRKTLAPAVDTRVVFKDSGFADNDAKLNMAAILTQAGIKDMRSL